MPDEPTNIELAEQIEQVRKDLADVKEDTGGMLSSTDFRRYVIKSDLPKAKQLFIRRKWSQIASKRSFIIDPFDVLNLTPYSYDLAIGQEAFSCKSESHSSFPLKEDKENAYYVEPGETIIVRTKEYIALPPCYSATVWPRFNLVREGIFQSMVKIDPTWYGQLGVALTNMSPALYPIWQGKKFATLIIYELSKESDICLFKKHETLDDGYQGKINITSFTDLITKDKLRDIGLADKCKINDEQLVIEVALTPEEFGKLFDLSKDLQWQQNVEDAIRIKTMDALGLPQLDLILDKDPDGEKLIRNEVLTANFTQQDLINTAIERGKPFDMVAAIPGLVMEMAENEVIPKIEAEVEASLFPKVVTLTLTVLGFLSFIVAVAAFVFDKYKTGSLLAGIDWPGTVIFIVIILGVIILISLLVLLFRKPPDTRDSKYLKKQSKHYRGIINSLRNEFNELDEQKKSLIKAIERLSRDLAKEEKRKERIKN